MQRAARHRGEAHVLAMKKVKPGMNEFQVEAIDGIVYARPRARAASPTTRSSAAAIMRRSCITSRTTPLKDGDLILIDAGAEYQGYASDITRTFPVNGKFTQAQREVYDVVLDVQKKCIEYTKDRQHGQEPSRIFDRASDRGNEKARPC